MAPPRARARPKRKASNQAASSSRSKKPAPIRHKPSDVIEAHLNNDPNEPPPTSFCLPAARKKFETCFKDNSLIQERSFPHDDQHPAFPIVQRNQWLSLFTRPEVGYRSLVREFFANAMFGEEEKYFVRGVHVTITVDHIRHYYGLPAVSCKYQELMKNEADLDLALIGQRISKATYKDKWAAALTRSDLREAAKFWHYFLCYNILPTSHLHKISTARAVLIYCIMENHPVDLATIIYNNLLHSIKQLATLSEDKKFTMIYPHLISALCVRQDVPHYVLEKLEPPKPFRLESVHQAIEEENALNAVANQGGEAPNDSRDAVVPSPPVSRPPPPQPFATRVLRELADLKDIVQTHLMQQAQELAALKEMVQTLVAQQPPPSQPSTHTPP